MDVTDASQLEGLIVRSISQAQQNANAADGAEIGAAVEDLESSLTSVVYVELDDHGVRRVRTNLPNLRIVLIDSGKCDASALLRLQKAAAKRLPYVLPRVRG